MLRTRVTFGAAVLVLAVVAVLSWREPLVMSAVRATLALPLVLILPGLALLQLVDSGGNVRGPVRFVFCLGLSLSVCAVAGLLFNLLALSLSTATWGALIAIAVFAVAGQLWARARGDVLGRSPDVATAESGQVVRLIRALAAVAAVILGTGAAWAGLGSTPDIAFVGTAVPTGVNGIEVQVWTWWVPLVAAMAMLWLWSARQWGSGPARSTLSAAKGVRGARLQWRDTLGFLTAVALASGAVYIAAVGNREQPEGFTQLWALPADGQSYEAVRLGVWSSELQPTEYRLEVQSEGTVVSEDRIALSPGERWETRIDLLPALNAATSIRLYRANDDAEAYRELEIWPYSTSAS